MYSYSLSLTALIRFLSFLFLNLLWTQLFHEHYSHTPCWLHFIHRNHIIVNLVLLWSYLLFKSNRSRVRITVFVFFLFLWIHCPRNKHYGFYIIMMLFFRLCYRNRQNLARRQAIFVGAILSNSLSCWIKLFPVRFPENF